jgi:hypothetical protein
MSSPQKFIPPDIDRDELTPRELELLAVLEQLTGMVNHLQDKLYALEQDIAGLRKAGKRT